MDDPVIVSPASGHKCARCWNFMPEVSNYGIWQNVCTRCQDALEGNEDRIRRSQTEAASVSYSPSLAACTGCCSSPRSIIFLDRLTKTWVTLHIPMGGAIPVIPRVLRITHWTNDGAAFSLFADSASPHAVRWGLIGFSSLAALVVLIAHGPPRQTASRSPPSRWR